MRNQAGRDSRRNEGVGGLAALSEDVDERDDAGAHGAHRRSHAKGSLSAGMHYTAAGGYSAQHKGFSVAKGTREELAGVGK